MKIKRLVVILVVLAISTAGLFADIEYSSIPSAVATLRANKGEFLYHGFADNESDTSFDTTITIEDAFTTAPSFYYGYKTNAAGTYVFKMNVSDFENQTNAGVVKISSVTSSDHTSLEYNATGYEIFSEEETTMTPATRTNYTLVTITPATVADVADHTGLHTISESETVGGASAGEYVATITFSVSAT